mmetsp:Transcript_8633/g.12545  ORF Transcript_8633/g.12545 Transcript_8633/m.12545 type:complete len:319 (-) Transcript_8633:254-1210(-)|eukprot:CAMPEP_0195508356 /NCGR_PEP_ID=MMETSP0794_2-20130614/1582_1 /TAXON_ID=515487 /ORGANISM="Stephanopyxis turris, Strain CCMP 815" /LENGTH=318 /DNA_ID=CAMNT_0040635293 /DNA_START=78 /DNA_END=1034 /DNA_ORIENTATION=+
MPAQSKAQKRSAPASDAANANKRGRPKAKAAPATTFVNMVVAGKQTASGAYKLLVASAKDSGAKPPTLRSFREQIRDARKTVVKAKKVKERKERPERKRFGTHKGVEYHFSDTGPILACCSRLQLESAPDARHKHTRAQVQAHAEANKEIAARYSQAFKAAQEAVVAARSTNTEQVAVSAEACCRAQEKEFDLPEGCIGHNRVLAYIRKSGGKGPLSPTHRGKQQSAESLEQLEWAAKEFANIETAGKTSSQILAELQERCTAAGLPARSKSWLWTKLRTLHPKECGGATHRQEEDWSETVDRWNNTTWVSGGSSKRL